MLASNDHVGRVCLSVCLSVRACMDMDSQSPTHPPGVQADEPGAEVAEALADIGGVALPQQPDFPLLVEHPGILQRRPLAGAERTQGLQVLQAGALALLLRLWRFKNY